MADAFSSGTAANATQPLHPRQWMTPGWFWALLSPEDAGQVWTDFTRRNPAIRTTKTASDGSRGAWVLFQVTGTAPVVWTLPGLPSKALKGADTQYQDVIDHGDVPPDAAQSILDTLGKIGDSLGTAGKVLLWGGVGILLFRVFQATSGGSRSSSRARDRDEPEDHHERVTLTRRPRAS